MRPVVLTLAALLPVLDRADAQDILSTLQFPTSSRQIYSDAATPNAKSQKDGLEMSSTASIDRPSRPAAKSPSIQKYGDVAPPMTIHKAPKGVVFSSGASMVGELPKVRFATSPRALYGSN